MQPARSTATETSSSRRTGLSKRHAARPGRSRVLAIVAAMLQELRGGAAAPALDDALEATARFVVRASTLPLQVDGTQRLQQGGAPVLVCNQASYVDWLLLTAELPAQVCFVAKGELRRNPVLGWLLERVGTRFVTRDDASQGVADAREGGSLLFFPKARSRARPASRLSTWAPSSSAPRAVPRCCR